MEQVRYECPSHPRTQVGCLRACCSSLATLILATRSSRLLLQIFFSAVRKTPFNRPTDRRLAHFNPTSYREKFASLPVSSPWTGPKIFLKQSYNTLVKLRRFARSLLGDKNALLVELLEVTPDRRTVYSEPMGGLAFRDTPPYRLYYLGAQVYRIRLHAPMMPAGATSPQGAVGERSCARSGEAWRCALPCSCSSRLDASPEGLTWPRRTDGHPHPPVERP